MLGMKISEDELDAMVAEIDKDGSGEVDFEEFLLIMSKRKDGSVQGWTEGELPADIVEMHVSVRQLDRETDWHPNSFSSLMTGTLSQGVVLYQGGSQESIQDLGWPQRPRGGHRARSAGEVLGEAWCQCHGGTSAVERGINKKKERFYA